MRTRLMALVLVSALVVIMGCGMVDSLLNQAVPSGGTAADLWPDVPKMDGMTKSNIEMPLAIRLIAQAAIKTAAASSGDSNAGMEFIVYTTAKTPDDLAAFYTKERMQAAGWNDPDMPGCTGENPGSSGSANAGGLCLFAKQEGGKGSLLAIIAAEDAKTKQTQLFFTRVSGTSSKTKGTSAPAAATP